MENLKNNQVEKTHFNFGSKTFLLPVKKELVDLNKINIFAEKNNFEEKKEFHITILGFKHAKILKDFMSKLDQESFVEFKHKLDTLNNKYSFNFNLKNEFFLVKKDYISKKDNIENVEHRESIIQNVEMLDVDSYFKDFSDLLGFYIEPTFPHITLYTKGNSMGIGINSKEEFESLKPEKIEI